MRTGIAATSGNVIIIQDADLEYGPHDINKLMQVFCEKEVDAVYGSRFMNWRAKYSRYTQHYFANKTLTILSNLFSGLRLTDVETLCKVIKGCLLRGMPINSKRIGFEIEVTSCLAKKKAKLVEVPVFYAGRTLAREIRLVLKMV